MNRARPRREDGLTLPELLVTIVLLGLVVVPLCTSLTQALTLVPAAGARSYSAAVHDQLVHQLVDDVADAASVTKFNQVSCATSGSAWLLLLQWTDPSGSPVTDLWYLKFATPQSSQVTTVDVHRTVSGNDVVVETGYCIAGDRPVATPNVDAAPVGQNSSRHVSLLLDLRDTPTSSQGAFSVDATQRVTG